MSKNKNIDNEVDELFGQEPVQPENTEEVAGIQEDVENATSERKRNLMTSLLNSEGENVTSFKDLLKSIDLNGEWFRRNLFFICLVTACLLLFVTNRYQAQQEQIEESNLKIELAEMKYKWLTRFSELTTSTRQSQIEEQLRQKGDTTLTPNKKAPYLIRANK